MKETLVITVRATPRGLPLTIATRNFLKRLGRYCGLVVTDICAGPGRVRDERSDSQIAPFTKRENGSTAKRGQQ